MHFDHAKGSAQFIKESLSKGVFSEVFVIQRISFDAVEERSVVEGQDLLPGFVLEPIAEFSSRPFRGVRLSKVSL